jgi:Type IV secretion system pilin
MFKKIKQSIIVAASVLLFAVPVLAPAVAHAVDCTDPPTNSTPPGCTAPAAAGGSADIRNNLCGGVDLNANADAANCATNVDKTGASDANGLIKNVINIFSLVVGIVAVLMIIVGGFRYITSGGNDGNVGTAKNTILYAVIGLVIVALAQIIVRFVLTKTKV